MATVLALLALGAGAQALAPVGAAAMTSQQGSGECKAIGNTGIGMNAKGEFCDVGNPGTSWPAGDLYPVFGSLPKPPPKPPRLCPTSGSCLPDEGRSPDGDHGGETPRPGPKEKEHGLKPEASGKKPVKDKPKPKGGKKKDPLTVCRGLLETAKTYKDSIPGAKQALHDLYAKGAGDANALLKAAGYKASLEKLFAQTVREYEEHGDCLALTGPLPEPPKK